jgi:hypothetical protein
MILERPDLDGMRLIEEGSSQVFLMFGGRRHHISSSAVYDALFSEITGLVTFSDVALIAEGPELGDGTCLIRADESLFIYLVMRSAEGQVRRHFIPTYESLLDFCFDESKVRNVPPIVMEAIPEGEELVSAGDRAARR